MIVVPTRRGKETEKQRERREDSHVTMEAETRVMQLQAQERRGLLAASKTWGETRKD